MKLNFRKIIAKHFILRGEILSDDMRKNGEFISGWWLLSWCDMLSDELEGRQIESSTRKKAIQRLVPLFEKAMGKSFPGSKAKSSRRKTMRVAKKETKSKKSVRVSGTKGLTAATMKKGGKKKGGKKKDVQKTIASNIKAAKGNVKFTEDQKIKVLVDENPKRKGSSAFDKFKKYKDGMTVAQYLEKGGTRSALRYDTEHEFISIK